MRALIPWPESVLYSCTVKFVFLAQHKGVRCYTTSCREVSSITDVCAGQRFKHMFILEDSGVNGSMYHRSKSIASLGCSLCLSVSHMHLVRHDTSKFKLVQMGITFGLSFFEHTAEMLIPFHCQYLHRK